MELILVRAGRTQWDAERRLAGNLAIPLSPEGIEEAQAAFRTGEEFHVREVCTSVTLSALQTARILAAATGRPLRKVEGFEEVDLGMWQGLRAGDLKQRHPRAYAIWLSTPLAVVPPRGEWLADAYQRLVDTFEGFFLQYGKSTSLAVVLPPMAHALLLCYLKDVGPEKYWEEAGEGFQWGRFQV
ncbi:MAG: histidine phosphatase family protein [Planctomycetota bacterium]|jgi:probable phosphoglycerate mutase